jgi:cell division protein ZapA
MGVVSLTLDGRTYRLGCGAGEEPRLRALGDFLAATVERLATEHGAVGHDKLLVMAALLIADELLDERDAKVETVASLTNGRLAVTTKSEVES